MPPVYPTFFTLSTVEPNIYFMDVNRRLFANLTDDRASSNWSLAWSPDGQQLAFLSNRDESTDIYVLDMNDFSLGRLFLNSGIRQGFSWSPDGKLIAFTLAGAEEYDIHVLDIQTGIDNVVLSDTLTIDTILGWSPDGEWIAFSRMTENGNVRISAVNINSSEIYEITDDIGFDIRPSWSSDGNSIAFVSTRSGETYADIYTINVDGSDLNLVTEHLSRTDDPAWSPDSQYLSFIADSEEGSFDPEIYLMNMNDGSLVRVTYNQLIESSPAWRPQP